MDHIVDYCKSASEVRKEWSNTIDTVIREHPVFIQRTRDHLILLDLSTLKLAFENLRFTLVFYSEENGSVTCVEDSLNLIENAPTKEACIDRMIDAMRDYANDYYNEFSFWAKAPNRRGHIPYVLKVLSSTDAEIREDIICRDGKS